MTSKPARSSDTFTFPRDYTFPPFWSIQPTFATRQDQFQKWSSLIQAYCRQKRILRLMLVDALNTPLFHNAQLRKRLTLLEAREIVDWMTREEGDKRAEWIGKESERGSAWIYWKRPEEWAEAFSSWVEETAQKNTVLTLYELTEGEVTMSEEFHGMDPEILQKSLAVLVKRGKAQVFGSEDQKGVKFF
ncbi:hypothetical protein MMC14_004491 [Varicellaria rhodocarpa]|nr:hypothetical protein [Varicellaria rhodocarpa]